VGAGGDTGEHGLRGPAPGPRDEAPPAGEDGCADDDFTAERAASSLGGFQRGTLRARAEDGSDPEDPSDPPERDPAPSGACSSPTSPTPARPSDRS
ncbi:hypothetical protein, partial [Streptomyces sp. NPDC003514]